MNETALVLILLLFAGHWAADYTKLSRPYMLAAKAKGKPLVPIAAHALVHAVFVFASIAIVFAHADLFEFGAIRLLMICLFEWITHFAIDVLKGRLNVWHPSLASPANPYHWYVFGADQWLHHAVLAIIAFFALK